MKKITYIFTILCLLFSNCWITAFGRDIQWDEEDLSNEVTVTISASVPEGFDERIEVYLNNSPHPLTKDYQYTMELPLDKNTVYDVVVLSSTDIKDRYAFSAPDTLSPSQDKKMTIQVTELFEEPSENNSNLETDGITEIDDLEITPSQYDFSDDQESGIIHISMKDYGVFDTVTYRLVGEKAVYDIVLDSEHYFQADVILPKGSYYESSTMSYTFQDWVPENQLDFALEHAGQQGNFGKYYDVSTAEDIYIDDLIIYMISGNNSMEVNANIINDSVVVEQSIAMQQEHEKKELESAFPELTETTSEAETIPEAQEIEEEPFNMSNLPFVIGGLLCGFGIGFAIYQFRKRKRK